MANPLSRLLKLTPVVLPPLEVITIASPAAGADLTYTNPEVVPIFVRALLLRLTASATVINRNVALTADDGVNKFLAVFANYSQPASEVDDYSFFPGSFDGRRLNGVVHAPILPPEGIYLPVGGRLKTVTANLQVGDQFSAIFAVIHKG